MDDNDRTWPACFDVSDHVIERLRAAAERDLERACDTGGEWDDEIRARVLHAARIVEAFDVLGLSPALIAALADRAIEDEHGEAVPDGSEDLGAFVVRSRICRELIDLREAATAHVELRGGPDAS